MIIIICLLWKKEKSAELGVVGIWASNFCDYDG